MGLRTVERAGRICRAIERRGWVGGTAFAGYLALSFSFFGVPVLAHPERMVVGGLFTDPQIFVWAFAWWPHAIAHGENPFVTHAIWAPNGVNLAWTTTTPLLAIVFAPLTVAFGPILAYNVACVVMPALAAWAAFLLCRQLTHTIWPSLAGGYLFGFSSYILGGQLSHIHTVVVFLIPLGALLILRYLQGELRARRLVLWLGVLLAAQAYASTEILFTLTLALGCSLVLGAVLVRTFRSRVGKLAGLLACAYALGGLLASPLLYYVLVGRDSRPQQAAESFVADGLNFVVPTRASLGGWWSAGLAAHFPANDIERGTYLGVPTLAIVLWFAWSRWRLPGGRFLLTCFFVSVIASFGSWLTVDGHRLVVLPWSHLASRPLFTELMPVRFSLFTSLVAAVTVAIWAASMSRPSWIRALGGGLAVLAVVPNVGWGGWSRSPDVPALFTTGLYKDCLVRGENTLLLPFGSLGDSMIWQADSGFWFRIAGGYISPSAPPGFDAPKSVQQIAANDLPPKVTSETVRRYARLKGVTTIVLDADQGSIWRPVLAPLAKPQAAGGALIYRLSAGRAETAAGCSRASAAEGH